MLIYTLCKSANTVGKMSLLCHFIWRDNDILPAVTFQVVTKEGRIIRGKLRTLDVRLQTNMDNESQISKMQIQLSSNYEFSDLLITYITSALYYNAL